MTGSPVVDIRYTYGAAFIGLIASAVFYGVTVTQTWIYYCHYRSRDPMTLKAYITCLVIMDTLHTILCVYALYWYLILNFGDVANLNFNMWAMNIQVDINALTGYLVQLFYARRVYIISNNIIIPVIIVILGGISMALGTLFTIRSFALKQYSRYTALIWVTCVGMSSAAVADILIALAMCWYLYQKRTGFSKTDSIIVTLMTYSVNTGLLTSILATGKLVCFVIMPTNLVWEVFFWLMGKSYVNSFLAILNNRDTLRERPSKDNSNDAFRIASIRPNETSYKSKTGPSAVTFAVNQTVISDFVPGTPVSDIEPGLVKSEGIIIASVHDQSPESTV